MVAVDQNSDIYVYFNKKSNHAVECKVKRKSILEEGEKEWQCLGDNLDYDDEFWTTALEFDASGAHMVLGGSDGRLQLWNMRTIPTLLQEFAAPIIQCSKHLGDDWLWVSALVTPFKPSSEDTVKLVAGYSVRRGTHEWGLVAQWDAERGLLDWEFELEKPVSSLARRWKLENNSGEGEHNPFCFAVCCSDSTVWKCEGFQRAGKMRFTKTLLWAPRTSNASYTQAEELPDEKGPADEGNEDSVINTSPIPSDDEKSEASTNFQTSAPVPQNKRKYSWGKVAWGVDAVYFLTGQGTLFVLDPSDGQQKMMWNSPGSSSKMNFLQIGGGRRNEQEYLLVSGGRGISLLRRVTPDEWGKPDPLDQRVLLEGEYLRAMHSYGSKVAMGVGLKWGSCCFGKVVNSNDPLAVPKPVLMGVPWHTSISKGQEKVYIWDLTGWGPHAVPTMLPAPSAEGVALVSWQNGHEMAVVVDIKGRVFYLRPEIKSDFPGCMYPPGFQVMEENAEYVEPEDALDILSEDSKETSATEETENTECITVDLETKESPSILDLVIAPKIGRGLGLHFSKSSVFSGASEPTSIAGISLVYPVPKQVQDGSFKRQAALSAARRQKKRKTTASICIPMALVSAAGPPTASAGPSITIAASSASASLPQLPPAVVAAPGSERTILALPPAIATVGPPAALPVVTPVVNLSPPRPKPAAIKVIGPAVDKVAPIIPKKSVLEKANMTVTSFAGKQVLMSANSKPGPWMEEQKTPPVANRFGRTSNISSAASLLPLL